MLQGRQAGKKVVVIKQLDEGTKERPYPHAIVAGIERYPRKVTKRMGKKKVSQRSKVKPFIRVSNFSPSVQEGLAADRFVLLLVYDALKLRQSYDGNLIGRPSIAPTSSLLGTLSNSRGSKASAAQRPSKSLHNERMQRRR